MQEGRLIAVSISDPNFKGNKRTQENKERGEIHAAKKDGGIPIKRLDPIVRPKHNPKTMISTVSHPHNAMEGVETAPLNSGRTQDDFRSMLFAKK